MDTKSGVRVATVHVADVVSIEREPRGRADYGDRVEARRERLEGAAEKARAAGEAAMERGRAMANAIPLGQPIMIGHHSEKRDRSFRARAQASMRRGVDALARASELASAASSVGTAGISSDDPEAVAKLRAEHERLVEKRDRMKATNVAWRKAKTPEAREAIVLETVTSESARAAMRSLGHDLPFPAYALTNTNANIRRIEKRIAELSASAPTMEPIDGGWFQIEARADLNRVSIKAARRLSRESFVSLKSSGWRWSPTEGAFLRMLNDAGIYAAKRAAALLAAEVSP